MGKDIPWFGEAWATRTTVRFHIISCFSCFSIRFLSSQGGVIQGTWSEYPEWSYPWNTRELLSFKSFVSNLTFLILSTILYAEFWIIYFLLYSIMCNKSVINWKYNAHRCKRSYVTCWNTCSGNLQQFLTTQISCIGTIVIYMMSVNIGHNSSLEESFCKIQCS